MYVLMYNTALHLSSRLTAMPNLALKRDAAKARSPLLLLEGLPQIYK